MESDQKIVLEYVPSRRCDSNLAVQGSSQRGLGRAVRELGAHSKGCRTADCVTWRSVS